MASVAGRKIFVGSLPPNIAPDLLIAEFSKFGQVEDVFIKPDCEPSRQWAFITFASQEQAQYAKDSCDRQLVIPGWDKPCDVMLAKNQGLFGQDPLGAVPGAAGSEPKKIFVGSLPDGVQDGMLRAEYARYGNIEEVFIKQGCPSGRQWAFITFSSPQEAAFAQSSTNNILVFPGGVKACEVTLARNQGLFGQNPTGEPQFGQNPAGMAAPQHVPPAFGGMPQVASGAPKKIFVGSLPDYISDEMLRAEFGKFGNITDVFVKTGCEPGRQWAFVTFTSPQEAQYAKDSCDRILAFPGAEKACEVTLARNQGKFGQEAITGGAAPAAYGQPAPMEGPKKIFVGSLPDGIGEDHLRAEYSRYGQVTEVFLKMGAHSGRHWAFVSFNSAEQASNAKVGTDRILTFPGSTQPCEVKLAKNQGLFGQNNIDGTPQPQVGYAAAPAAYGAPAGYSAAQQYAPGMGQVVPPPQQQGHFAAPPPPATPPPAHLTPWRMFKTVAGIPYYHNSQTGITQWECPPDLQAQAQVGGARYAPY
mmetsp:Transcript_173532/g.556554  ORF Transcript_173532/g.556554 Transcript_173532/m.556554 type:complete len:530 (-) Transcript_173532:233-1822(-)